MIVSPAAVDGDRVAARAPPARPRARARRRRADTRRRAPFHSSSSCARSCSVTSGSAETRASRRCGSPPSSSIAEMAEHAVDRRRVEQRRCGTASRRAARSTARPSRARDRTWSSSSRSRTARVSRAAQPQPARRVVLQDEVHLREAGRLAAALALHRGAQRLEGQLGVLARVEVLLLHAREQRAEGRIVGERGAQRDRVDEVADDPLELGAPAAGDDRADDEVVLAACSGAAASRSRRGAP